MGELWERWWPTMLGGVLVTIAGFFLWPEDDRARAERDRADRSQVALGQTASALATAEALPPSPTTDPRGTDLDRQRQLEDARLRVALREAADERDAAPERTLAPEPGAAIADEPQRSVTLTQNSPEVQRALRLVEVELYETNWCQYCKKTRAFLDRSGIGYRAYDVEADETANLRKHRLAPGRGVPVTVIDGETLYGFSEAALNAAFQAAISRRLAVR